MLSGHKFEQPPQITQKHRVRILKQNPAKSRFPTAPASQCSSVGERATTHPQENFPRRQKPVVKCELHFKLGFPRPTAETDSLRCFHLTQLSQSEPRHGCCTMSGPNTEPSCQSRLKVQHKALRSEGRGTLLQ